MTTHGLCFGKFYPPHLGHFFLCDVALRNCDKLTIIVCSTPHEKIDGHLRYKWMKEAYGDKARVLHLHADLPQTPEEMETPQAFYKLWSEELYKVNGWHNPFDVLFTSEEYGEKFAPYLSLGNMWGFGEADEHYHKCRHFMVDQERKYVPTSGTACRTNPFAEWKHMHPVVRKHFTQKVLIVGGESCGKSTLTNRLAAHYTGQGMICANVQEYARSWIDGNLGGDVSKVTLDHITHFGKTQHAMVKALGENGDSQLIFSDTDALTSAIFQVEWFNEVDAELGALIWSEEYCRMFDLILLLHPTVPWVDDGQRNLPHRRQEIATMLREGYRMRGMNVVDIDSFDYEERFKAAVEAVDKLIEGMAV